MSDSQRLKNVIEWSKMTTNEFSVSCGFERSTVLYNVLNEKTKISVKVCKKICNKYEEINYDWLLTGKGTMLSNTDHTIPEPINQIINDKTNIMDANLYFRMMDFIMKESSEKTELIKLLSNKIPDVELKAIEKGAESKKVI